MIIVSVAKNKQSLWGNTATTIPFVPVDLSVFQENHDDGTLWYVTDRLGRPQQSVSIISLDDNQPLSLQTTDQPGVFSSERIE